MKVQDVYQRANLMIEADESIRDAAVRMDNHAIGSLAVYRNRQLVGIITERDLVRAVAGSADVATSPVEEFMTAGVVTVTPDDDITEAAARMVTLGARHLPVVDDMDRMMGMLSARDLVTMLAAEKTRS